MAEAATAPVSDSVAATAAAPVESHDLPDDAESTWSIEGSAGDPHDVGPRQPSDLEVAAPVHTPATAAPEAGPARGPDGRFLPKNAAPQTDQQSAPEEPAQPAQAQKPAAKPEAPAQKYDNRHYEIAYNAAGMTAAEVENYPGGWEALAPRLRSSMEQRIALQNAQAELAQLRQQLQGQAPANGHANGHNGHTQPHTPPSPSNIPAKFEFREEDGFEPDHPVSKLSTWVNSRFEQAQANSQAIDARLAKFEALHDSLVALVQANEQARLQSQAQQFHQVVDQLGNPDVFGTPQQINFPNRQRVWDRAQQIAQLPGAATSFQDAIAKAYRMEFGDQLAQATVSQIAATTKDRLGMRVASPTSRRPTAPSSDIETIEEMHKLMRQRGMWDQPIDYGFAEHVAAQ